jgi:phosphoribosylamine--glycine ligase
MKVLVIGSGGREHALVWKIKQSPLVKRVYCIPGNAGIDALAECVEGDPTDIPSLIKFAKDKKIALTVVGPEVPLVEGIVDAFEAEGLKIFGPSKLASQLEGSKVFAKDFMHQCNIPTAIFRTFDNIEKARHFVSQAEYPLVIKADGLASGKGVIICENQDQAEKALDQIMKEKIFNEAGAKVVIEEWLKGDEVSILAVSDGTNYILLDSAQDHKRIFDDDLGPNTGGMGAYSPAPIIDEELLKTIESRVIEPTIRGMKREGIAFKGILYAGLMITKNGPYVLEYNVRFGDPETQVILSRLKSDLVDIMLASIEGRIKDVRLEWDKRTSVCVVMSSGGYPGKYETGFEIKGLETIQEELDTIIFHAGTKRSGDKFVTAGGRVLGVTSLGKGLEKAMKRVYENVEMIKFDHAFFRRDIGSKGLLWVGTKPKAASHR